MDAESIVLLAALLEEMGVADVRLRLSSLGGASARVEYRERLQAHLRSHEAQLAEEVRERIELNPLRAFDSEHGGTRAAMASAPRLLDHLSAEDGEHFEEVRALLEEAGVAYEVDPTLVRGLDYYTRTVFEFTSEELGAQSGVGGGGRYDGLVAELGGPPTAGMGWAAGIERIMLAGQAPAAAPVAVDLYVAFEGSLEEGPRRGGGGGVREEAGRPATTADADPSERGSAARTAFGLLHEARGAGLTAQMELAGRSLKNQLAHAQRLGARYVAIVGAPEEGGAGETVLEDMQAHTREAVPTETVVHAVLRGLRDL